MSPEEQRIIIAKACGKWTDGIRFVDSDGDTCMGPRKTSNGVSFEGIPDYLNDLNAMREPLSLLGDMDRGGRFTYYLAQILWDSYGEDKRLIRGFDMLLATPAQLAQAFLETLSLWKP